MGLGLREVGQALLQVICKERMYSPTLPIPSPETLGVEDVALPRKAL